MKNTIVKRCRICGDKAKCFNHKALSCNPCRLLFNRNITRLDKLKCPKNENCEIDFASRKCCPKCRMAKCVAIGMDKSATKLIEPKKKLESNKNTIKNNKKPKKIKNRRLSKLITACKSTPIFELSQYKLDQIAQIQTALQPFEDENCLQVIGETTSAVTVINLLEVQLRRVIKFCKNITAFSALNNNDQLLILKGFFIECILIRNAFIYDFDQNCYASCVNESGNQAVLVRKSVFKGLKTYRLMNSTVGFGRVLQREMENDTIIRDLIICVAIFQARDGCSNAEFIRYHFFHYSRLLCRYFEHKYKNDRKASEKYARLVGHLKTLDRPVSPGTIELSPREIYVEMLKEIGVENLEQVLVETLI